jgi:hypothetical protein
MLGKSCFISPVGRYSTMASVSISMRERLLFPTLPEQVWAQSDIAADLKSRDVVTGGAIGEV